ncbi:MAG: T9SS type A sorting domain-containing protein [Ignavibacteriales bacterium]|nr:T9SS type A sorting domain-containing protein [Ignavibacteriales bacterium]
MLATLIIASVCTGQQITIYRIESMPNKPFPYFMRDWKRVAKGYDSLVFNLNATGQYLPFLSLYSNTVNYPGQGSFRLPSYVGSPGSGGEGVNCLPAVVGASLVGIDKSSQQGMNWVSMCKEWFNNRPAENVYLNQPRAGSGNDWWYETMPNVFFYQISALYPTTSDFSLQFTTVADRWLAALRSMGGGAAPWNVPNVNHRAWSLSTMTPNDGGVHEPEAAGAIGWILYNAFVKTGQTNYRMGAEWALEYLNSLQSNPAYELQLAYGVYIAARMNAELGTTYDVAKMLNWCFDIGPLRNWGAMGKDDNWFGYDCAGLIGEVNGVDNYAFAMNTFEQLGALVPLVRYDARFARAIAKWALNAANAARLFYPNYLPDDHQDSRLWSVSYDPGSYIAHEALRQYKSYLGPSNNTPGPYATGDAITGGWAATNLSLYSSSHVGIMGGIIDTTNVPMILRLDVLKTDYFHRPAYPTYLYFNPDSTLHAVNINTGSGQHDLYDAVSHLFVLQNVTGSISLPIKANTAMLIVIAPSAGAITYDLDRLLIDGVVVDFLTGRAVANYPPRIKSLVPDSSTILTKHAVHIYSTATDKNNDALTYSWGGSGGTILGGGSVVTWLAPDTVGTYVVTCTVTDMHGAQAISADTFNVVRSINNPPVIQKMKAIPKKINIGATTTLSCLAVDADSNALSYRWSARSGLLSGSGSLVSWQAPPTEGNYYIRCVVDDGLGGIATDSVGLEVRDFSKVQSGRLVAFYPFSGDAKDAGEFHHDGRVNGGSFVGDRFGHPSNAFSLDGATASIVVPNDSGLNFQNGITVNFWMTVRAFYEREQYPISHGNWQNRWKVSISNKYLRWTVKTPTGTKDLDSETQLTLDSLYNVTVIYSGADMEIYLNGALDAFSAWSGAMMTTSYDLTIGQDLPGDNNYNFKGVLDDIRIYDYALSVQQIANLFDINTAVTVTNDPGSLTSFVLYQNYPNPFNPSTIIRFNVPPPQRVLVRVEVYDVLGRRVDTLLDGEVVGGLQEVVWNAGRFPSGVYYCRLTTSSTTQSRKMILVK